jgi:Ribbon-helix-helix protein, copG family
MGMQRVIVSMPDELVAAIDAEAERRDRSRSWLIRQALRSFYTPSGTPYSEPAPVTVTATNPADVPRHPFTPQDGNKLRCSECGKRLAAHPQPVRTVKREERL